MLHNVGNEDEVADQLGSLGLEQEEERIYRALVRQPSVDQSALKILTGISAVHIRRVMSHLEELGLLRQSDTSASGYVVVAPDLALSSLINRRRAELDSLQIATADLAERFRASRMERDPSELVEVVMGPEISDRALALGLGAKDEILAFDRPPYVTWVTPTEELDAEQPLLERGVRIRIIYSTDALEASGRLPALLSLARLGEESRVLPELPIKLRIIDREKAMVPLTGQAHATESVAIIHRSGLLEALIALFESYWSQAIPLIANPQNTAMPEISPGQQRVLNLLAAGLKDQSIARQLGVSMRTSRRRISEVMTALHASTRFQAGAHAARSGWI
jgi:sugar-specific transcriptional regulator TrmB/DNA-binding CsgD family transcriptional regulator